MVEDRNGLIRSCMRATMVVTPTSSFGLSNSRRDIHRGNRATGANARVSTESGTHKLETTKF